MLEILLGTALGVFAVFLGLGILTSLVVLYYATKEAQKRDRDS